MFSFELNETLRFVNCLCRLKVINRIWDVLKVFREKPSTSSILMLQSLSISVWMLFPTNYGLKRCICTSFYLDRNVYVVYSCAIVESVSALASKCFASYIGNRAKPSYIHIFIELFNSVLTGQQLHLVISYKSSASHWNV